MRLLDRLLHRDEPEETICPRCGVPTPYGSTECTACGWDLREAYHEATPDEAAPKDIPN